MKEYQTFSSENCHFYSREIALILQRRVMRCGDCISPFLLYVSVNNLGKS